MIIIIIACKNVCVNCSVGRSLQSKGHIHSSGRVFEVVGGLSSSTEMSCLMVLRYIPAKSGNHRATTTLVTVTVTEMMWHTTAMETSSMVCCTDLLMCFWNYSYCWILL